MKIPPIRPKFLLVLTAILIYGVAITVNMACMAKGVYDWRTGQSFFNGISFISFVMAFVALFRREK